MNHFYPTDDTYDDDGKRCDPIIVYEERRCLESDDDATEVLPQRRVVSFERKTRHNKLIRMKK